MPDVKILLVDDDKLLRESLQGALRREGFDVDEAGDGEAAVEKLDGSHYDVVLLDILMPKMDGFEVLAHIREYKLPARVIMITGHTDLNQAMKSKKMGADDFIGKPFDLEDVRMSIHRVLER